MTTREDRLAELLERWEDTLTTGGAATPEDLCRDCPDLLADFCGLLARLGAVNALLGGDGASAASPAELAARVEAGRYKPLSFHAEGGLGVVFVAEDGELRRNVALKCMQQAAALDDDARARFLLEAEITSKLEHPGVVPVYGLGRDAAGRPYYAMRFIHGATLADAVERFHAAAADGSERPVELQRLIRRFVSVCETMAYAHARGVVHRDLKPSNIMLGAYGETLVVDWGLAKRLERADEGSGNPTPEPLRLLLQGDGGRTVPGEVRGSPAYMSPEQARGEWDRIGRASDVYSLGATLYVLLTGRPPYAGRNTYETVEKVKAGACPPPRAVNPAVPKPLDAICCKAMRFEPGERYAGAAELARDLERWLADEPVTAWREPWALRARRWLRRHQTLAAAAAASFLVAFASVAVAGWRLDVKNKALDKANTTLDERNRELEQTNRELTLAKITVERTNGTLERVNKTLDEQKTELKQKNAQAENNLLRSYDLMSDLLQYTHSGENLARFKVDPDYQTLLADLTRQTDKMQEENPDHAAALQFCARLHFEQALMDPRPGLPAEVGRHLDLAQQYYERKLQLKADDPLHVGRLGFTHVERANRLFADKNYPAATKEYLTAFDLHLPYGRTAADVDGGQNATGLYLTCQALGWLQGQPGAPPAAEVVARIERAVAALDPGDRDRVNLAQRTYYAATLRKQQADLLLKSGNKDRGLAALERVLADTAKPPDPDPFAYDRALLRSQTFIRLAMAEWERDRKDESFRRMADGYRTFRAAAEKFPAKADVQDVQRIPVAFASVSGWKANELDPKEPDRRAERRRVVADALDALDWMEREVAARKLKLSPDVQATAAGLRKQLEQLRPEEK
jgi:hypothetical protein